MCSNKRIASDLNALELLESQRASQAHEVWGVPYRQACKFYDKKRFEGLWDCTWSLHTAHLTEEGHDALKRLREAGVQNLSELPL